MGLYLKSTIGFEKLSFSVSEVSLHLLPSAPPGSF